MRRPTPGTAVMVVACRIALFGVVASLSFSAVRANARTTTGGVSPTEKRCTALGAWADTCYYENICFNEGAESPIFISDRPIDLGHSTRSAPIFAATKLLRNIVLPPAHRPLPVYYKRGHLSTVPTRWVEEHAKDIEWHDDPIWIPGYFERLKNVWFFASRILPLYSAYRERELLGLPEMSTVFIPQDVDRMKKRDWHREMIRLSVTNATKVHFINDNPFYNLAPGSANPTQCFRKVVLLGANMYAFPDMMAGYDFRNKVYRDLGMKPLIAPPKTVTILDRERWQSRHFANPQQIKEIIRSYGVEPEYVVFNNDDTFKRQVEVMANTGVLVTMHGAGLMNEIFLPPGAAVIEIFPVHLKHVLYERIAHYAGVYHFKVYSREFTQDFHASHSGYLRHECDKVASLSIPDHGYCWPLVKNSAVVAPLQEFAAAFANALDHIGVRTKLKKLPIDALPAVDVSVPTRRR